MLISTLSLILLLNKVTVADAKTISTTHIDARTHILSLKQSLSMIVHNNNALMQIKLYVFIPISNSIAII